MMDPHYEWKNWLLVAKIDYFIWILTTISCCFFSFLPYSNGFFVRSRKLCKGPIEIQREDTWPMMDPHYEWKNWLLVAKIDYFIWILTTINWLIFTISALFKWIFSPIKKAVQGANWSPKRGHLTHDGSSLWMEELTASCQNRLFYLNPYYYKLLFF